MKIIKERSVYHIYAFESKYDNDIVSYCQFLKTSFGSQNFSWDTDGRKWRFSDSTIVTMMKDKFPRLEIETSVAIDVYLDQKGKKEQKEQEEKIEKIKEGISSGVKINGIKGELYPYQKLGIEFLLNSGGRALLADSPGVGKTVQALGYLTHSEHKRTLIVCPASVKFSWESEIKKWTNLKSFVIDPQTKLEDIPPDVNCIIVNFDILKKFYNEFMKYKFDALIVDECHMIKSEKAIRSKVVKSISREIKNVILLTGTPVLSRPIEIFNTLNIIDQRYWNSWYNFAIRYADGKRTFWGFEAKGATNLDELKQKISKYFLRRTKEEVLPNLPPKNRIEVPIDLPKEERKQYELVESNLVKYLKEYKKDKTDKEIIKSLQAEKLVKLNLLREINTMGKIPAAKELIDNIIDSDEKVLVFSSFNAPLKELADEYEENSVMILGETPVGERGEIVNKFQTNSDTKIFFGGTLSAGVGITLTAASNIIFLDMPWRPGDIEQNENRAHRPGAEYESLNIYTIISRDSIDGFMKKVLQRKQEIIDQVIGGDEVESEEGMVNEYLETLQLKHKNGK